MKKLNLLTFILLTVLSTSSFAKVPVFGEIYVGGDNGKLVATTISGPSENATNSGSVVLGLRGGYKYSIFMLGVDATGTAGYLKYDITSVKNGYWNKTNTYLMVGLDFGLFRLWGDYGVFNQQQLLLDYTTYRTDKLYSGGLSYKVGAGVRLGSRISVNAEYYVNRPDKLQVNTGQVNFNNTYSKFEETGYMVSLSYLVNDSEITRK